MIRFRFIKKFFFFAIATFLFTSCNKGNKTTDEQKKEINTLLDNWHAAAAETNFNAYFDRISEGGIYIGTDATENWTKKEFEVWAKPYFEKGQAWSFTALERNIYFSEDEGLVWFDELLDTQMKICRGSGVLEKVGGEWKIKHYVLSVTVPNEDIEKVIEAKAKIENKLIQKLKAAN